MGDFNTDHIAIISNGSANHNLATNLAGPVDAIPGGVSTCDGNDHIFRVTWNSTAQQLRIFFDCNMRLLYTGDIVTNIFNGNPEVFWGFSGATGGLSNLQTACISSFAAGLPELFEICSGDDLQLGVVGAANGTYQWWPTDYLDDPTSPTPTAAPLETISYEVTFTDLCGDQTTLTTTVEVASLELEIAVDPEACEGETITLVASGNADNYEWSNGQSGAMASASSGESISVTASTAVCTVEETVQLTFYPMPEIDLASDFEICDGESLELAPTVSAGAELVWSNGTTGNTGTFTNPGLYSVTLTTDEGCTVSTEFNLSVAPLPVANLEPFISLCQGETALLAPEGGESFIWSTGSNSPTIEVSEPGVYEVLVTLNGCSGAFSTEVAVSPLPDFTLAESDEICSDEIGVIDLPNTEYLWQWNGEVVNDALQYSQAGIYTLTAEDPTSGCTQSTTFEVSVLQPPRLSLPETLTFCENTAAIVDLGQQPVGTEVTWSHGATGQVITVSEAGSYTATAVNQCGSQEATVALSRVMCDCLLYVPSAFTPDLDGINELFKPEVGCPVRDYRFTVFNRWGEAVFATNDPKRGWNGSGALGTHWVDNAVYLWKIEYHADLPGEAISVSKVGHVTLLR
jgi:gliding motility-associated-like protein